MHSPFLQETLRLARERRGFCAPNPAVGAVLVREGRILSRGRHWAPGYPHAEAEAIAALGEEPVPAGSTLYVSLEPCCHTAKRTPPCTGLLTARGVERVVFAAYDPNPRVNGGGQAALRAAGIACERVEIAEIEEFYRPYAHWSRTARPYVTAKLALSLDGKIAAAAGAPVAISGELAARFTHQRRREADAILTTARTIAADDPRLDARIAGEPPVGKKVFVLDRGARTPPGARVIETAAELTLLVGPEALATDRAEALRARGVRVEAVAVAAGTGLDLGAVFDRIGAAGVQDLWVEAGGTLFSALRAGGWLNRAFLYVAPRWLGPDALPAFPGGATASGGELFAGAEAIGWRGEGRDAVCEVRWSCSPG